jgi:hypoxanthine phosphoribosyltransferase
LAEVARRAGVTLAEAEDLARELAASVRQTGWRPDLIVGIANGGVHPAVFTAQALGVPVHFYRVQRKTTRLKQRLGFARRLLATPVLRRPVRKLSAFVDRRFSGVGEADGGLQQDVRGNTVLVVDDCIDSGASIAHVRAQLDRSGAVEVKIAVFCWTTKYDSQALHGVAPDYCLGRSLPSYPWSADNKDYPAFKRWLGSKLSGAAASPVSSEIRPMSGRDI